jgi:hypothetical protein
MKNEIVLMVFEGEKTEPQIYENMNRLFYLSRGSNVLRATYKKSIYSLWKKVENDPLGSLDIFEVLKDQDPSFFPDIKRDQISQIYLFFDHDAHCESSMTKAHSKIMQMLDFFDNETDSGKLFISYPMVEAIKDISSYGTICIDRCRHNFVNYVDYKHIVHERTIHRDIMQFSIQLWKQLIIANLIKANCIVNNDCSLPSFTMFKQINQKILAEQQEKKFISESDMIAIISAFPLFLVDYFDESFYVEMTTI